MVGRGAVARILAQQLPPLDVRVHRLPLDRPGPHERDLHRDVVDRLGPRAQDDLHLRAALDLEAADRVGPLDLGEHVRVVERDPREVDLLAVTSRDQVDAVLDRRQHPEPEQVDLEEAGVGAGVLVPLADLPALPSPPAARARARRAAATRSPSRPGAGRCGAAGRRSRRRGAPKARQRGERSFVAASGSAAISSATRCGVPAVGEAREPLELGVRAGRAPCRRRGSRRASDRSRSSRRARRARSRSAR